MNGAKYQSKNTNMNQTIEQQRAEIIEQYANDFHPSLKMAAKVMLEKGMEMEYDRPKWSNAKIYVPAPNPEFNGRASSAVIIEFKDGSITKSRYDHLLKKWRCRQQPVRWCEIPN